MPHPLFDELIHEPTRLQLSGLLAAVVEAEFAGGAELDVVVEQGVVVGRGRQHFGEQLHFFFGG